MLAVACPPAHDLDLEQCTPAARRPSIAPYAYELPPGYTPDDIAAMAVAGPNAERDDDHAYVWFKNGKVSAGSSDELDSVRSLYDYTLPPGYAPSDIVASAIAKVGTSSHTYTWFDDGKVSAGSSDDLDRYRAPYDYTLPPLRTPGDLVDVGIDEDDTVFAFFRQWHYTFGTTDDLYAHSQ